MSTKKTTFIVNIESPKKVLKFELHDGSALAQRDPEICQRCVHARDVYAEVASHLGRDVAFYLVKTDTNDVPDNPCTKTFKTKTFMGKPVCAKRKLPHDIAWTIKPGSRGKPSLVCPSRLIPGSARLKKPVRLIARVLKTPQTLQEQQHWRRGKWWSKGKHGKCPSRPYLFPILQTSVRTPLKRG